MHSVASQLRGLGRTESNLSRRQAARSVVGWDGEFQDPPLSERGSAKLSLTHSPGARSAQGAWALGVWDR